MNIYGTIKDGQTGAGIPGASVMVLDAAGNASNVGFATNSLGSFQYDVNPLAKLQITSVGYAPVTVPANYFASNGGGGSLSMNRSASMLDEVVVSFKKPGGNGWLWLIGGVVVAKILKLW